MANYRNSRFCENLNIAKFETEGRYNIPVLEPYVYEPCEFVGLTLQNPPKTRTRRVCISSWMITSLNDCGENLWRISI